MTTQISTLQAKLDALRRESKHPGMKDWSEIGATIHAGRLKQIEERIATREHQKTQDAFTRKHVTPVLHEQYCALADLLLKAKPVTGGPRNVGVEARMNHVADMLRALGEVPGAPSSSALLREVAEPAPAVSWADTEDE